MALALEPNEQRQIVAGSGDTLSKVIVRSVDINISVSDTIYESATRRYYQVALVVDPHRTMEFIFDSELRPVHMGPRGFVRQW